MYFRRTSSGFPGSCCSQKARNWKQKSSKSALRIETSNKHSLLENVSRHNGTSQPIYLVQRLQVQSIFYTPLLFWCERNGWSFFAYGRRLCGICSSLYLQFFRFPPELKPISRLVSFFIGRNQNDESVWKYGHNYPFSSGVWRSRLCASI